MYFYCYSIKLKDFLKMKRMTALEKEVNYYLDSGLKLEVSKKLDEMVENGTIKSIINDIIIENYS